MQRTWLWTTLAIVALTLVWGTQFLVIQLGQRDLPPLLSAALRFALLAIIAQGAIGLTRARAPEGHGLERLGLGATHAASMGLLYWADGHLPSSLAGILFATMPFFVATLAQRFVPGEVVTRRTVFGILVGFAGVALIAIRRGQAGATEALEVVAVLACLGAALAGAINRVASKRLTAKLSTWIILRDAGTVVAVSMAVASALFEHDRTVAFTASAVAAFLYLGIVASAAASGLYLALLRRHPVTALSYLQFTNAVVAMAAGTLVGGETLSPYGVVGATVTLAGLWLVLAGSARAVDASSDARS